MDKTGNPADKTQQMGDPEVVTLVDALITSTESPVGSNDVFKSAIEPTSSAARRTTGSSTRNDFKGSEVTMFGTVTLLGISAMALAVVILLFEL